MATEVHGGGGGDVDVKLQLLLTT